MKGTLFHDAIDHFWDKLGTEEEVAKTKNKKNGKKYFDAKSFSDYLSGVWISKVIGAEHSGRKINWDYPGQGYSMKPKIHEIAFCLFPYILERGKPLYSEIPFQFILGNRKFNGRIDEIRLKNGKVVVTDFKSGTPFMKEIKRDHDIQMTMYNVGIGSLCYANEEFAKSLGFGDIRKTFFGHPNFVNENVEHEFIMIEAPVRIKQLQQMGKTNLPEFSLKTFRKENHFYEILKMLDGVEASLKNGIVYPQTGHKCDYCVMKEICKKRLESLAFEIPVDKTGQIIMSFASPTYKLPVKKEDVESHQLNLWDRLKSRYFLRKRIKKAQKTLEDSV
jgi:hypothetical protein